MKLDLHTHTTCSDGVLLPQLLVNKAVEEGLQYLSITDHDTANAYHGLHVPPTLTLIQGAELCASMGSLGCEVLVYGRQLSAFMDWAKLSEKYRMMIHQHELNHLINVIEGYGIRYTGERTLFKLHQYPGEVCYANTATNPALRAFIAAQGIENQNQLYRAMYRTNSVFCNKNPLLQPSTEEIAYRAKIYDMITIYAHPYVYGFDNPEQCVEKALSGGVYGTETYYGSNTPQQVQTLSDIVTKHSALHSAGCDYHGRGGRTVLGQELNDIQAEQVLKWLRYI